MRMNDLVNPFGVRGLLALMLPALWLLAGCGGGACLEAGTYECKSEISSSTCPKGKNAPNIPVSNATTIKEACGDWSSDFKVDDKKAKYSLSCKTSGFITSSTTYEGTSDCTTTVNALTCSYSTTMQCTKQ